MVRTGLGMTPSSQPIRGLLDYLRDSYRVRPNFFRLTYPRSNVLSLQTRLGLAKPVLVEPVQDLLGGRTDPDHI